MKDFKTLQFLVVEDSQTDYLLLQDKFEELDVSPDQLHWFKSLGEVKPGTYDIALCDLNLPDSDKVETISALQSKFKHLPIIALTGVLELSLALKTINEGAQDFLVKGSFTTSHLFKAISFALERQRLLYDISKSKEEYELIFNDNPHPLIVFNANTFALHKANNSALKLYEYSKNEVHSMTFFDMISPSEVSSTKNSLSRALNMDKGMNSPEAFIHMSKSGKSIHVELIFQHFEGEQNLVIATIKDVTDKHNAEQALNKSEQLFEFATQATSDIIYDWDISVNRLEWNGKSIKNFYYDKGPLNIQQWISIMHPDDRVHFSTITDLVLSGKKGKSEWSVQYRLKDRSNNYRHVQDRAIVLFDSQNNPERIIGAIEDITEKVDAQTVLALSEKKYNLYFNESPLPKFLCHSEDLLIEQTNHKAQEILEGMSGHCQTIDYLIDSSERNTFKKLVRDHAIESTYGLGEWHLADSKSGNILLYQISMHPIQVEGKSQILFTLTDITELGDTRNTLQDYIKQYELVLSATNGAVWDFNVSTGDLLWGENYGLIFGYDPKTTRKFSDWSNKVHPKDIKHVLDSFDSAFNGDASKWQCEYRFQRSDGSYAHVKDQCTFVRDKNGKPTRVTGALQDVSSQKKQGDTLKLMKKVVANANDPILITEAKPIHSPGPRITYANQAFLKQTGYTEKEILGETPRILQGPKTDREQLDKLRKSLENWQPCEVELINYKKNGETFWVEMSIFPVADKDGLYTHWVSIQRDTTERHEKEEIKDVFRKMNIAVSKPNSLSERYSAVLKEILNYTDLDVAEGWITNIDGTTLNRVDTIKRSEKFDAFIQDSEKLKSVKFGEGLPGEVWEKDKVVIWENLPDHPNFFRNTSAGKSGLNTTIAIPVYRADILIGVIILFSTKTLIDIRPIHSFLKKISRRFGPELKRMKTEEELKTIVELTPNLLFVINEEGKIIKGNRQLFNTVNLSEDTCIGLKIWKFIQDLNRQEFQEFLHELHKSGKALDINIPIIVNNQKVWIDITAIFNPNEALFYCVGKNVTAEKNLEDLLIKAHLMARLGSWEVNLVDHFVYWSSVTKQIHEVAEDYQPELESAIDFYKEGPSRNLVQKKVEMAMTGEIDGWEIDAELVTAKGNVKWVRAQGQVERVNGEVTRMYGSFQDIDKQKQTEIQLHEANLRYDLASKAANIGVWDWDIKTGALLWDETMMNLYGVDSAQFDGTHNAWLKSLHPEDMESQNKEMEEALQGQKNFSTQFRIIQPNNGQVKHLRSFGYIIWNDKKEATRVIGIDYDVTDQVEHQAKLEKAYIDREDILESITDGFFSANQDWILTYWNKAAEKLLGRSRDEVLGKNLWDAYPDAIQLKFYDQYNLTMNKGIVTRFTEYYPKLDTWYEVVCYPKDDGVSVFFKDITEKVEQDKKVKELKLLQEHVINSTVDLIWAIDENSQLLLANDAFLKEIKQVSLRQGHHWLPLMQSKDQLMTKDELKTFWQQKYNEALKGRNQSFRVELKSSKDMNRTQDVGLYPIRDSESGQEQIIGVACFSRDITVQVNHTREIEGKNAILKDIAWTHSHVVRAIVARILGLTGLLKEGELVEEEVSETIRYIVESSNELDMEIRKINNKNETVQ